MAGFDRAITAHPTLSVSGTPTRYVYRSDGTLASGSTENVNSVIKGTIGSVDIYGSHAKAVQNAQVETGWRVRMAVGRYLVTISKRASQLDTLIIEQAALAINGAAQTLTTGVTQHSTASAQTITSPLSPSAAVPPVSTASGVASHTNREPTSNTFQSCGANVTTGPHTSCGFAEAVYRAVGAHYQHTGQIPANVSAFSPATDRAYGLRCVITSQGTEVTCNTTTGASMSLNAAALVDQNPTNGRTRFSPTPDEIAQAERALSFCQRAQPGVTIRFLEMLAATPLGIQC
jgi:hypothetical protein